MSLQAAIELIKDRLTSFEGRSPDMIMVVFGPGYIKSLRQALILLQAAEKVDKHECLAWLDLARAWFIPDHPINADYVQPQDQVRALLESLPDAKE